MLGAVIGDIVGSIYEFNNHRSKKFELFDSRSTFTDDSVLSFATAKVLLDGTDYAQTYQEFARRYPGRGYGGNFSLWIHSENALPYNSFGNGSAMRVSPVGFAYNTLEETLKEARRSAMVTHNHPEGVKGAQAVACAIFLARSGENKTSIKREITSRFEYDLSQPIETIRLINRFDETCQGSVPEAIIAFLKSDSFEDAIRTAISIGGDSDTIACITGGIAQAFYQDIPEWIAQEAKLRLPLEFVELLGRFETKFM